MVEIQNASVAASSGRRLFMAATTAILTYFAARVVLEMHDLPVAWRLAAALVPVPLFAWLLLELVRGARSLDEMQRRIQLEAVAIAYPLVVMLLMTLGLIELVVPLNRNDWSYRHVWQMQALLYFIGLLVAKRRYEGHD
jgi:hypothetical protein